MFQEFEKQRRFAITKFNLLSVLSDPHKLDTLAPESFLIGARLVQLPGRHPDDIVGNRYRGSDNTSGDEISCIWHNCNSRLNSSVEQSLLSLKIEHLIIDL